MASGLCSIAGLAVFIGALALVGSGIQQFPGGAGGHLTDQDRRTQHQQDPRSGGDHVNRHLLARGVEWAGGVGHHRGSSYPGDIQIHGAPGVVQHSCGASTSPVRRSYVPIRTGLIRQIR